MDLEKAAYMYVFTRTWIPPYDQELIWSEAQMAFKEGCQWVIESQRAEKEAIKYLCEEKLQQVKGKSDKEKSKALESFVEDLLRQLRL